MFILFILSDVFLFYLEIYINNHRFLLGDCESGCSVPITLSFIFSKASMRSFNFFIEDWTTSISSFCFASFSFAFRSLSAFSFWLIHIIERWKNGSPKAFRIYALQPFQSYLLSYSQTTKAPATPNRNVSPIKSAPCFNAASWSKGWIDRTL